MLRLNGVGRISGLGSRGRCEGDDEYGGSEFVYQGNTETCLDLFSPLCV